MARRFGIALATLMLLAAAPAAAMPLCDAGKRVNCVVDGDTLWVAGEMIRLFGIDAPEIRAGCAAEAALAIVTIRGRDLGELLVSESLARPWTGRRETWCMG